MINVIWHNNDIQIIKTIKHVKHQIKLEINVMRPSNKTSKNYLGECGLYRASSARYNNWADKYI